MVALKAYANSHGIKIEVVIAGKTPKDETQRLWQKVQAKAVRKLYDSVQFE